MGATHSKWDLLVVVLCAVLIVMTAGAVSEMNTEEALRETCRKNLASLGKVIPIYARDYEDELPVGGGRESVWAPTIPNWMAALRTQAFGINPRDGRAGKNTTTASLYMLVKYAEARTPDFVCPSEPATRAFTLGDAKEPIPKEFEFIDAWDFGGRYDDCNNPSRHCSFSYHVPFDRKQALTLAHNAGMAVLADRSPWIDPKRTNDVDLGWARFLEASEGADPNQLRLGNSDAHQRDGQNVLFIDGHVTFQTRATCGVKGDNIYTMAASPSESDPSRETPPEVYRSARPAHRRDSVLIQELPYVLRESDRKDK